MPSASRLAQLLRRLLIEAASFAATVTVVVLLPQTVLGRPYLIPSASMEPTLVQGDTIAVSKFAYGWSRHSLPFSPPLGPGRLFARAPHRGDIVVFKLPRDGDTDYIKRLVGLPGDRLQVVHNVLYINGAPVQRQPVPGLHEGTQFGATMPLEEARETLPNGRTFTTQNLGPDGPSANTGLYTVPPGCYFMMGDNRDNSLDSRFDPGGAAPGDTKCAWDAALDGFLPPEQGVGFVPQDDLVGRAELILYSWRPGTEPYKPWTWITEARWDRFFRRLS
jgi:signal peptidase I